MSNLKIKGELVVQSHRKSSKGNNHKIPAFKLKIKMKAKTAVLHCLKKNEFIRSNKSNWDPFQKHPQMQNQIFKLAALYGCVFQVALYGQAKFNK